MNTKHLLTTGIVALVLTAVSARAAGITFVDLNPPGSTESVARSTTGSQQAGYATIGGVAIAVIWSGTAASYVNLNPPGSDGSKATATTGVQQAGYAIFGGRRYPVIWSGTAASYVNLNPPGATDSYVNATTGTQQAGYAHFLFQGLDVAGIWSGTAASFVNLNPGVYASYAYATTGTQQAGSVTIGGFLNQGQLYGGDPNACIWSGTAASFVNLNPFGATRSAAFDITGTQQAGWANTGGVTSAGIWSGTAASFVNLNPSGATESVAYATDGKQQAGYAHFGANANAGIWSGMADSFVNLQSVLGSGYIDSIAESIWDDGTTTFVSGYADTTDRQQHAILWMVPDAVPEPTSAALLAAGCTLLAARSRRSA